MTIFDLASILLLLGIGTAGGYLGFQSYGIMGAVVGGAGGLFTAFLFVIAISRVWGALFRWYPFLPTCQNGRCNFVNYTFVGIREGYLEYQCQCGTRYLLKGRQFLQILPDGGLEMYMRKKWFRGWVRDQSQD